MKIFYWIRKKKRSHVFDLKDLKPRDSNGNVSWACTKCGEEFKADCGLSILRHGKMINNL